MDLNPDSIPEKILTDILPYCSVWSTFIPEKKEQSNFLFGIYDFGFRFVDQYRMVGYKGDSSGSCVGFLVISIRVFWA